MHIKKISLNSLTYILLTFITFWYFYFASSFVLRPYPQLFWAAMVMISFYVGILHNYKFSQIDKSFFGCMILLGVLSVFSVDTYDSISVIGNFVIYYIVARMISNNCTGKTLYKIIMFFSIVHLICIFVQVFLPGLYMSKILPLLPASRHSEITMQMDYNFSYYGFTVQTSISAMYLSIGAVIFAIKANYSESTKQRLVFVVLTALFMFATFYTQRRGSSVVALLIIALIYYKSKGNSLSKIFIAVSIVLLIVIIGLENIPGLDGILGKFEKLQASGSITSGRDRNFARALNSFYEKPIFGHGIGQIDKAMGYAWLENSYLKILAECGIVGGLVFFLPYITMFKDTVAKYKNNRDIYLEYALYIQILYLLMSIIENYYADPLTVFLLFVIVFTQENKHVAKNP